MKYIIHNNKRRDIENDKFYEDLKRRAKKPSDEYIKTR